MAPRRAGWIRHAGLLAIAGLTVLLAACRSEPLVRAEATLYRSAEGAKAGVSPVPLVVFGHHADSLAKRMSEDTTMNCLAVRSPEALEDVLRHQEVLALLAMSRQDHPGEAETAIRSYRALGLSGPAFYAPWGYNVERAARRALDCGADGIAMPGALVSEQYGYLLGVMKEVHDGDPRPSSPSEHEARLRRYMTDKSPFWKLQDLPETDLH